MWCLSVQCRAQSANCAECDGVRNLYSVHSMHFVVVALKGVVQCAVRQPAQVPWAESQYAFLMRGVDPYGR